MKYLLFTTVSACVFSFASFVCSPIASAAPMSENSQSCRDLSARIEIARIADEDFNAYDDADGTGDPSDEAIAADGQLEHELQVADTLSLTCKAPKLIASLNDLELRVLVRDVKDKDTEYFLEYHLNEATADLDVMRLNGAARTMPQEFFTLQDIVGFWHKCAHLTWKSLVKPPPKYSFEKIDDAALSCPSKPQ